MQLQPAASTAGSSSLHQSLPPPLGGVNEAVPVNAMKATDALRIVNGVVHDDGIMARAGTRNHGTIPGGAVQSMLNWAGEHAFAASASGLYRVQPNIVTPAVTLGITQGRWLGDMMSTPGGAFLVASNGFDGVKVYDGTVWRNCPVEGMQNPERLSCPTWHNRRVWFFKRGTLDCYYFEPSMFGGSAKLFPQAGVFNKGGEIVAIASMNGDNAENEGDQLVILTSKGQIAIYRGHDPQRAETWGKVGTWDGPVPLGWRPMANIGGNTAIITKEGVITVPDLTKAKSERKDTTLTDRVTNTVYRETLSPHAAHWQLIETGAEHGAVILNRPDRNQSVLASKGWSEWREIDATAWTYGDQCGAMFGTANGDVKLYGFGNDDDTRPIAGEIIHAPSKLGSPRLKTVTRVRPNIEAPPMNPRFHAVSDTQEPKDRYRLVNATVGKPVAPVAFDTSLNTPVTKSRWGWRGCAGRGHMLAMVFAWDSRGPMTYRGMDVQANVGGNI
jgi:hypothetical protein